MARRDAGAWTERSQHMSIEDTDFEDSNGIPLGWTVDPLEAERLVESLKKYDVEEIGCSAWLQQHEIIERLNIQSHQSATSNSDDYVLEAILTHDKLDVLVNDLITLEAWKENIYPLLLDDIAGKNTMRCYFILYHEATLVNFFEILFYHKYVCERLGEKMIDLVDYCSRKLTRLNGGYDFRSLEPAANASINSENLKAYSKKLEERTPKEELAQHLTEIEFRVCIAACSLSRFICEHSDAMPLSVASRITDTHDFLILTVPLIENPPWTRRLDNGKWQKLVDQNWKSIEPIDLLKLTKYEGQPWLMLFHLMTKENFRERYHLNTFRKSQLLRVRKYLNEVMLDQMPILADIQRYMDELQLTEVPEPQSVQDNVFMFQQVAVTRENATKGKNWSEIAAKALETVFTMTDKNDDDLKRIANVYTDFGDDEDGLDAETQEILRKAQQNKSERLEEINGE